MDQKRFDTLCQEVVDNLADGDYILGAKIVEKTDTVCTIMMIDRDNGPDNGEMSTISYLNEDVVLVDGMRIHYCPSVVRVFLHGLFHTA